MTIEKRNNTFDFFCDNCDERLMTNEVEFKDAVSVLKSEGWISKKTEEGWEHLCPECK